MDIILDFLENQSNSSRVKASFFFQENEALITRMTYDIPKLNAHQLKKFWKDILDSFQQSFILDYNLVDWERLIKLIRKNIISNEADDVVNEMLRAKLYEKSAPVDEIDKFFNTENDDIPYGCEPINLRNNFNSERKKLKKSINIRDQDYLYYGILDFVSKIDEKKTNLLLGADYSKWSANLVERATHLRSNSKIDDNAHEFVKDVLFGINGATSKTKEKGAKQKLSRDDNDYKLKKKCLELIKIQRHRLNENADENEYTFIIKYFSKILITACYCHKSIWNIKWGETKLAASKEEENLAKKDNENRASGASIDAIIASKEFGLEFLLLEVSGPMLKEDYDHFLKDRLKIAKNLKYIFKSILRQKLVLSDASGIKLFGIQVYRNTVYVYALLMPIMNMFCFVEVMKFKIPVNQATYPKDTPRYIKNLLKMVSLIHDGYLGLKDYLFLHDDYDSDESYSDKDGDLTPPYISPQKITGKRKDDSNSSESGKRHRG